MTRKTYMKKIRNATYQLNQLPSTTKKIPDFRIKRPDFGFVPECGKYAGVKITSYAQMWDVFVEAVKDLPIADKI